MSNNSVGAPRCIYCGESKDLANSHVISEFIRNKLFGQDSRKSNRYDFKSKRANGVRSAAANVKIIATQSLPTAPLMCIECDSHFGGTIEAEVSRLIDNSGIAQKPNLIYTSLNLTRAPHEETLLGRDAPCGYSVFDSCPIENLTLLGHFARLTCWRAMHAMARSGISEVEKFIKSPLGAAADMNARNLLDSKDRTILDHAELLLPDKELLLDTLGGNTSWSSYGWYWSHDNALGKAVVVWCSHWVAVWVPAAFVTSMDLPGFITHSLIDSRAALKQSISNLSLTP
ncbi:hypothetical protein ABH944_007423 [Caballeronia udeis]|uniref:Uncharacterized protein n=1 Tax=Caballeronia udeis TaxID=1232866 RepID=A0ABW8MX07_9BURK